MSDESLGEGKELVGSNPEKRNWRGILIAILVILIVFALIIVAIILVSPKEDGEKVGQPFTFDDVFNPEFKPRQFKAQWIGDRNVYVYRSREGEVMEYDADLNKTEIIMDNSTFRELNTDQYSMSEDLTYVLLAYDVERVYRHSTRAKYKIYNRFAKNPKDKLIQFPQGLQKEWDNKKLQYAGWSSKAHSLTFVYNNNMYVQVDPFTTPVEVTNTGSRYVFNGIPDWLYEEELIHTNVAHWWSPDDHTICYAQTDDTNVPLYRFPYYGQGVNIYGDIDEIAYPKAGDRTEAINPTVRLFLVNVGNPRAAHKELSPPHQFNGLEYYFTSATWQDNNHILIIWTNRIQNRTIARLCDTRSADCYNNLVENAHEHGWSEFPAPMFVEGGQSYLAILPELDGIYGYWKHVTIVTAPWGHVHGRKTWLTQGTWDVLGLVGFSEEFKQVYYLANNGDPRKRHLFRVGISDRDATMLTPECITCGYREDCQYVDASFSRSGKYYILECLGPAIPTYILKSTVDKRNIVVEDNADVRTRLKTKALPLREYIEIETQEGHKIWTMMLLPPKLNREHITVYPLLVHTYAGPGDQKVTEQFHIGWETYLVSTEEVVFALVDGRGSGGRGDRWLYQIYRQLGNKEVQDQITGARFLKNSFSFIDKERIAIWGWSYGGFVTAHALGDTSNIYTCGVAVAPVTDWRYYDTAYTERYMGLAHSDDNYRGYDNANVSRKAANFKGKHFMIVHGTADDNVHFQHTAQLIKALTAADVDYRVQVYADNNHALEGPKTSRHLYRTMTSFIRETCWKGGKPRKPAETDSTDE